MNPCAYPGRNSSRQVVTHLEKLACREGYQFVAPPGSGQSAGDQKQVMLVIVDSEAPALGEIDAAFRRLGGRAVCAANPLILDRQGSRTSLPPGLLRNCRPADVGSGPLAARRP